jgi:NarL family two-component system response regulator YdfI
VTRVLIVAASPLVRAGLQNVLGSLRFDVVGSVSNLESLSEQFIDAEPEAIVIEVTGESHEAVMDALVASELARESAVIILTDQPPPGWAAEAVRGGARAILPSDISPDQLQAAIEAAIAGLVVIHPGEVNSVVSASAPVPAPLADLPEPLTRREREVLQMLASGLGNKEIAARLSISEHTVKFHVASILGKLGASTRTEAVSLGIRRGLVLL